jgi:hypothetical protein
MSSEDWVKWAELAAVRSRAQEEQAISKSRQQQYIEWLKRLKEQEKRVELPDSFDVWVEEVRRQSRMEELVTAVYDAVMKNKLPKE